MEKFQEEIDIPKCIGDQRRIGITGGIASGKSTIGSYLEKIKNLPILDADVFSREALKPGTNAYHSVIQRYKTGVLKNKLIDRKVLSKIIFNDANERLWLESLIHPIIYNKFSEAIQCHQQSKILIMIVPLLLEANFTDLCTEVWVVNCSKEQQLKRLITRDSLNKDEAIKKIEAQWPLEKKIKFANFVIDNSSESNVWKEQIDNLI
ncbi:dephospho-CoA kinase [Prochlorococcus sp. MIT 1223]|uniref:dephospho-CoA kinase n=1 Tax=Prochlorococcus sp. MIT 1223 TaxID=3096217 RepID=UPI002A75DCB1|nr:dephospho-CoA kinase [Prochlorococcus sp. MIT 1223]